MVRRTLGRAGGFLTLRCTEDGAGCLARAAGREFAGVEDDIVAFTVAEGLGDAESEAGGFQGEGEFGKFSATLGGEFAMTGRLGVRR
jgi:hypothetical protein